MKKRIDDLVKELNYHTDLYDQGIPVITDKEWDSLYFELVQLEGETGYYRSDSPTQKVHYETKFILNKIEHNHPMLSLQKTKDLAEVRDFAYGQPILAMLKMDGLTCSLKYEKGRLVAAETRGNGLVGEDILHNALVVQNIPNRIDYYDDLVVDGEIICSYANFQEFANDYKNPRNFAAGSIRLLDSGECAKRKLSFVAWNVITGIKHAPYISHKLTTLGMLGFTVVPNVTIPSGVIHDSHIEYLTFEAEYLDYPIDGLVFKYDDVAYGNSLGATEHHFNDAIAYKFYDEEYETELIDIEWTMGRTGILTPVAIVQPVDTGDSIVERASLHNLSIMKSLLGSPRFGQKVKLIKSNMIIPQIIWGEETCGQGNLLPPAKCPICGGDTVINKDNDSEFLFCSNPECSGKLLNKIDHYCGKKGLDIKGLSVSTIAKLMDWGWVNSIKDIYNLHNRREEWIAKPGYGERSVDKILAAIEESKSTTFVKYLSAIGIPLIGTAVAKELNKTFMGWSDFRLAVKESFAFYTLDTFGIEKHRSLLLFDYTEFDEIATMLSFEEDSIAQAANSVSLQGITVVITGKLINYKNRSELQAAIESAGGKVASSVSKNTNYLINNDTTSGSSKNLTAKKLGIEIISEQEFIEKFLTF